MKVEWNKVTWYSKLLALILFVALPFIGFYLGVRYEELITNNQKLITDNEQAKTDNQRQAIDTSTWKTYRNEKYGFEFQYPRDWSIEGTQKEFSITLAKAQPSINVVIADPVTLALSMQCPWGIHEIECAVRTNQHLSTYIRSVNTGQLTLDRQQQLNGVFETPELSVQFIMLLTDQEGVAIPHAFYGEGVFDRILSTFKFIEPTKNQKLVVDTSTWKTYRNDKYGFEVKYPGSWVGGEEEDGNRGDDQNTSTYILDQCSPYLIGAHDRVVDFSGGGEPGGYGSGNSLQIGLSDFSGKEVIYLGDYSDGSDTDLNIVNTEKLLNGDASVKNRISTADKTKGDDLIGSVTNFAGKLAFHQGRQMTGGPCDSGPDGITEKENFALYEFLSHGQYVSILISTKPEQREIFDQIVPTFKFIEPTKNQN